jgi:hypothetical protein
MSEIKLGGCKEMLPMPEVLGDSRENVNIEEDITIMHLNQQKRQSFKIAYCTSRTTHDTLSVVPPGATVVVPPVRTGVHSAPLTRQRPAEGERDGPREPGPCEPD